MDRHGSNSGGGGSARCFECGIASKLASAAKDAWSCITCAGGSATPSESGSRPLTPVPQSRLNAKNPFVVPIRRRDAAPLAQPGSVPVGQAVLDYINFVEDYVEKTVPSSCWPGVDPDLGIATIPNINRLRAYAVELDYVADPACSRQMFDSLLERAAHVDFEYPIPLNFAPFQLPGRAVPTTLTFPRDHHYHPTWGSEWYYVCAKVPVRDAHGNVGEACILSSMQRVRAVGLTTQQQHGWTDAQSNIFNNVATVTVRFTECGKVTRTVYARESRNTHWPAVEPNAVAFSKPGESFGVTIGQGNNKVSWSSSQPATATEILPATFSITDQVNGTMNIQTDLVFKSAKGVNKNQGWFYQGIPDPSQYTKDGAIGAPGLGFTLPSTPGIYYSWPQTVVTGKKLVVNGETFTITGQGNGWVDHQTMGTNLFNFDPSNFSNLYPVQPIPFRQDASPVNGWTWNFCNYADGTSWTGAAFEQGNTALAALTVNPYGYSVKRVKGLWVGAFNFGATTQIASTWVTSPAGMPITAPPTPLVSQFQVANDRAFAETVGGVFLTKATGWVDPNGNKLRADFNNANYTTIAECPADWVSPTSTGWGYLETVSYEPVFATQVRMMHYLDNSTYPDEAALVQDVRAP